MLQALRGILSAHVSAFPITSAQAIINIRFGMYFSCALLHGGTAEHEHAALILYWFTTRYKILLFVLRILEWVRTRPIYNTLIPTDIKKYRVRTP